MRKRYKFWCENVIFVVSKFGVKTLTFGVKTRAEQKDMLVNRLVCTIFIFLVRVRIKNIAKRKCFGAKSNIQKISAIKKQK